jgi:hypothetical protein
MISSETQGSHAATEQGSYKNPWSPLALRMQPVSRSKSSRDVSRSKSSRAPRHTVGGFRTLVARLQEPCTLYLSAHSRFDAMYLVLLAHQRFMHIYIHGTRVVRGATPLCPAGHRTMARLSVLHAACKVID